MQRIIQFLKWLTDWDGKRFQTEVDRMVVKNRQWQRYEAGKRIGPPDTAGVRPVDLDNPHRLPIDQDDPLELLTAAGTRISVAARHDGITVYVRRVRDPVVPIDLAPAEAQWLLKAVRQQNDIVKQRLGIAPYDDQRPGSALDQSIGHKSATHAIERALDGMRRKPVEYSKDPWPFDRTTY